MVALTRLLLAPDSAPLTDEQRRQLSLIDASGQSLLSLVGDLLDVAKAEAGQLEINAAPTDLRALLAQLGAVMRNTGTLDVALLMPEPSALPVAVTDEALLTRILRNLLSNALKFTEKGEVSLEFRVDAPWMVFTVTDTGVGIPEDELSKVFEEFYQVRGPLQRTHRGTGLGLPYARTLTELLGGSLRLSSTPGAGTRVEVELPFTPVPPTSAPAAPENTP